jgi:uncharacterized protein YejL (UPF0352 family)
MMANLSGIGALIGLGYGIWEGKQKRDKLNELLKGGENVAMSEKLYAAAMADPSLLGTKMYHNMVNDSVQIEQQQAAIAKAQAEAQQAALQRQRQEDALPALIAGLQRQGASPEVIQQAKSDYYEQFGSGEQVGRVQAANIQAPVAALENQNKVTAATIENQRKAEADRIAAAAKLKQDEIDNAISQGGLDVQRATLANTRAQQQITNEAAIAERDYKRNQDLKLPEATRVKVAANDNLIDNLKKYQNMAIENNFPVTGSTATELASMRKGIAQQIGYDISGASLTQNMVDDIEKRVFDSGFYVGTNKDKNKFNRSINLLIDEYTAKNKGLRGTSGGTYTPPPPPRK